jgi:hypothetical protein
MGLAVILQVSARGYIMKFLVTQLNCPYVYDYIIKSCRQQAEVIQNHENENIRGLNLAAVMCTTVQVSKTAVVD